MIEKHRVERARRVWGLRMSDVETLPVLLTVRLNGAEIARVTSGEPPCELKPSREVGPNAILEFETSSGERHTHTLADLSGWAHISIRVHDNLGCQADCAVTQSATYDPQDLTNGKGGGVRFQPFFLPGSPANPAALRGKGLFQRGLHFPGSVTPGWIRLSCECDGCGRTFHIRSFHAGFSNVEYMYSRSGLYTLVIDGHAPGAPGALGAADPTALAKLEASLPPAPDGTDFKYLNPFRCPHCRAAYIDFERYPELRPNEYYGNYLPGSELLHFPPREAEMAQPTPTAAPSRSRRGGLLGLFRKAKT